MVYKWKTGHYKANVQEVGKLLEILEEKGELNTKNLVEISRDENAILHNEFEWNDSVAADKFRETQARIIIANVVVVAENKEPTRAFVNISYKERKADYQSIARVLCDEELKERLLQQALFDFDAYRKKYETLEELACLWKARESMEE